MAADLSATLSCNLSNLKKSFAESSDYYAKQFSFQGISCAIVLITGLSSPEKLWIIALDALNRELLPAKTGPELIEYLLHGSTIPTETALVSSRQELIEKLCNGMAMFLADGCAGAVAFSVQDMPQRSVTTPSGEGDIRGSQEAFTELLRSNVAMLRRQFRSGTLAAEICTANTAAKTEYALCYDKTLAPQKMVEDVRRRLQKIQLPVLLDSSYFASFFKNDKLNLFPAAAYTERTATACARLCEGKIVILVSGSPFAMVVPSFFSENFECLDDYSSSAVFSGLVRILKYLAFALAVFGPGLYLLAVDYAPEMIPSQLLTMLAQAEAKTPLPMMAEVLLVMILLEIVREAGLRTPSSIGHTVSIVGALILGETAVTAGILSVPVLIVAAGAMVATLAVPALYEQSILFRFAVILLSGTFGMPGFACAATLIVAMACGSDPFGYNYLYPLMPMHRAAWQDGIVRSIWSVLGRKGYVIGRNERK